MNQFFLVSPHKCPSQQIESSSPLLLLSSVASASHKSPDGGAWQLVAPRRGGKALRGAGAVVSGAGTAVTFPSMSDPVCWPRPETGKGTAVQGGSFGGAPAATEACDPPRGGRVTP